MLCTDTLNHIFSFLPFIHVRILNSQFRNLIDQSLNEHFPDLLSFLNNQCSVIISQRIYYRSLLNNIKLIQYDNDDLIHWLNTRNKILYIQNMLYHLNHKKQRLLIKLRSLLQAINT